LLRKGLVMPTARTILAIKWVNPNKYEFSKPDALALDVLNRENAKLHVPATLS
jgi:hypothetical protein